MDNRIQLKKMKPIKSTAEILAYKVLNRSVDEQWSTWAYEMILAGFNTENLIILAGERKPFNQFEMKELTEKVFAELNMDYSNQEQVIKNYIYYLIERVLVTYEQDAFSVLGILMNIYNEFDHPSYLQDFYMLYFAKEDLRHGDMQWYWDGADKNNIDEVITNYFIEWEQKWLIEN